MLRVRRTLALRGVQKAHSRGLCSQLQEPQINSQGGMIRHSSIQCRLVQYSQTPKGKMMIRNGSNSKTWERARSISKVGSFRIVRAKPTSFLKSSSYRWALDAL